MITVRVRSAMWFATGAVVVLAVSLLVMDAWRADAAPGDADSTFVTMTSCRLIDTRPLPDRIGPFASWGPNETKMLQATGTNGNCTIPADAVGLSMNVTALNATLDGFLTFWPSGPLPLAASLNPSPGAPPIPNAVTVSLSAAGEFNVYNENGNVDIIIDVNGFHTQSSLKELNTRLVASEAKIVASEAKIVASEAKIVASEARIAALEAAGRYAKVDADTGGATLIRGQGVASVSRVGTGVYQVDFAAPVDQCGWFAALNDNADGIVAPGQIGVEQASVLEPHRLWIRTWDSAGVAQDRSATDGFSLHVVC